MKSIPSRNYEIAGWTFLVLGYAMHPIYLFFALALFLTRIAIGDGNV